MKTVIFAFASVMALGLFSACDSTIGGDSTSTPMKQAKAGTATLDKIEEAGNYVNEYKYGSEKSNDSRDSEEDSDVAELKARIAQLEADAAAKAVAPQAAQALVVTNSSAPPSSGSVLVRNGGTLTLDRADAAFEGGYTPIPDDPNTPNVDAGGAAYRCENGAIKLQVPGGKKLTSDAEAWLRSKDCSH